MDFKEFYTELGKLLYAVAKADGDVQEEELHRVYQLIIADLSDADLFERDNEVDAYHAEFTFELLLDQNSDMNEAIDSFKNFYKVNKLYFTDRMKLVTINAMIAVAEAFEGVIPEEQALIEDMKATLFS
jgi:uncharacterized tellurite resistance protein B-like protein